VELRRCSRRFGLRFSVGWTIFVFNYDRVPKRAGRRNSSVAGSPPNGRTEIKLSIKRPCSSPTRLHLIRATRKYRSGRRLIGRVYPLIPVAAAAISAVSAVTYSTRPAGRFERASSRRNVRPPVCWSSRLNCRRRLKFSVVATSCPPRPVFKT